MDQDSVLAPPENFRQKLGFLGPGFILSASVVGSGESGLLPGEDRAAAGIWPFVHYTWDYGHEPDE